MNDYNIILVLSNPKLILIRIIKDLSLLVEPVHKSVRI